MPTQWGPLGMAGLEAGGQAVGGLLGMVLGGVNDRRQIRQQQKLTDMQLAANQRMADYNQNLAYDMWQKTNYSAQKDQLNKAGLNPALLYGMGGGGGATTSGGQGSGVSGAQAPSGGGEIMAMMNQRAQLEMMAAQKANIEANTAKTKAEAANLPLQGQQITATITGQNIANEIAGQSMQNAIAIVQNNLLKLEEERRALVRSNTIGDETKDANINQAKAEAIGALIDNEAKKVNIQVDKATIQKMAADIAQGWKKLTIDEQNAASNKFAQEVKAKYPGLFQIPGAMLKDIMDAAGDKLSGGTREKHDTVPSKIH